MEKDTTDGYWLYDLKFSRNADSEYYGNIGTVKTDNERKKYLEFDLGAHISTD